MFVLTGVFLLTVQAAVAQDNIIQGLRGTVSGLPGGSLTLPPAAPVTITLTAAIDRGRSSLPVPLDLMPGTRVRLLNPVLSDGDLVEVDLTFLNGRFVVEDIGEAPLARFVGTAANVPGGTLALPVAENQVFSVRMAGLGDLPVVISPATRIDVASPLVEGATIEADVVLTASGFVATRLRD
jgi:hypothetical protein